MNRSRTSLAFSLCILAATSAQANVIYNSLGAGGVGNSYAVENINDANVDWGNQFLTPSGSSLTLDDVIASLVGLSGNAGSVTAYLYSDSGGVPGTQIDTIATLNQSSISSAGFNNITFTPTGTITLAPSTQYWIVLSGADDSSTDARWQYGESETGTGLAGESRAEWDGVAWVAIGNDANAIGIPEMEVDATAVPEPTALAALGVGLAGIAIRRRRQELAR